MSEKGGFYLANNLLWQGKNPERTGRKKALPDNRRAK